MCNVEVLVPIPALLWEAGAIGPWEDRSPAEFGTNDAGERCVRIDTCIVPAVKALWDAGVVTLSSCCGHTDGAWGVITLQTERCNTRKGTMLVRVEEYERVVAERDALRQLLVDNAMRAVPRHE